MELKDGADEVDAFTRLVIQHGVEDDVIVQCHDVSVLRQLAETFPAMRRLLLLSDIDDLENVLEEECVDIISVNKEYLSADVCQRVHSRDKLINVWTLNSLDEIRDAIDMGVDSYFTNYTAKALALEAKYRD